MYRKAKKRMYLCSSFSFGIFKARNVIWIYVQITRLLLWWCTMYSFTITLSFCALSWIAKRKISHTQKISQNKIEITKKTAKKYICLFSKKNPMQIFQVRERVNKWIVVFFLPSLAFSYFTSFAFWLLILFLWSHLFLFFLRKNYCAKYVCTFTFEIPSNHQTS